MRVGTDEPEVIERIAALDVGKAEVPPELRPRPAGRHRTCARLPGHAAGLRSR